MQIDRGVLQQDYAQNAYGYHYQLQRALPAEYKDKKFEVYHSYLAGKMIINMVCADGTMLCIHDEPAEFPSSALIGQMLLVL